MHLADWSIVVILVAFLICIGWRCLRYTHSVADYLAANRCAGRYVLGMSEGAAGIGAISFIAAFEMYYKAGFSIVWWGLLMVVVQILAALSGWVTYRFRQTRAMTLAQFLETRYSKRFRVFAGILAFTAGVINFGIFPAVSTRFFIYFCGFPEHFNLFGFQVLTFAVVMAALIIIALFFTYIGMIAIMVTDFLQGIFLNIVIIILLFFVLWKFNWSQITEALSAAPVGMSLIHPFHTSQAKDFNIWYYLIGAFGMFYTLYAWQGCQGYQIAAISAHENLMSKIIQTTKTQIQNLQIIIIPIAAYTFLHHTNFANEAQNVTNTLANIDNVMIRGQMTVPIVLRFILPVGLMGGVCAMMFCALISNHDTYLLSWGSVFIQDIILPFRKTRLTPRQHLKYLRCAIFGVAVFIYLFSFLFRQTQYIYMFFAITGAIWLGGAGSVIIGGLYWKRGTTAAAYSSLIVGSTLAVSGIVFEQIWPALHDGKKFPVNGQWMWLIAMVSSIIVYVLVSLLGKRVSFNLDRLLHRGQYSVSDENVIKAPKIKGFKALVGINNEFSARDIFTYLFCIGCTVIWIVLFVVGTTLNLFFEISTEAWAKFWHFFVWFTFILGTIMSVWIGVGGIRELPDLFVRLKKTKNDNTDDGQVRLEDVSRSMESCKFR
ncbi:MAG: hypothetical protein A2Y10_16035 [Planctomycetes bacterium GWF2_41_51]|nr:MAG: hypothetical protein A2Y10_16035 [Planctomycetes bacterium GWF2_41_51]HBG25647.1 sodium:solute symporter [Phycisphaerales bacterium]